MLFRTHNGMTGRILGHFRRWTGVAFLLICTSCASPRAADPSPEHLPNRGGHHIRPPNSGLLPRQVGRECPRWSPTTWRCRADALRQARLECFEWLDDGDPDRCVRLALAESEAFGDAAGDPETELSALNAALPYLPMAARRGLGRRMLRARQAAHPAESRLAEGTLGEGLREHFGTRIIDVVEVEGPTTSYAADFSTIDDTQDAHVDDQVVAEIVDGVDANSARLLRIGQQGGMNSLRFSLHHSASGYLLRDRKGDAIPIPKGWLEAKAEPEVSITADDRWARRVDAVPLGDGRLLLHFASYDIQGTGSAASATGRDLMLVLEPVSRMLAKAATPGVERGRGRYQGCWSAVVHQFRVADVTGDGVRDLGVSRESLSCRIGAEEHLEQVYEQTPVLWFALGANGFQQTYGAYIRKGAEEVRLPPIGITRSPVDFVLDISARARKTKADADHRTGCDKLRSPHEFARWDRTFNGRPCGPLFQKPR